MIVFNVPENMGFIEAFNAAMDIAGHSVGKPVNFKFNGFDFYVAKDHPMAIAPSFYDVKTEPSNVLIEELLRRVYAKCTDENSGPQEAAFVSGEIAELRAMFRLMLL